MIGQNRHGTAGSSSPTTPNVTIDARTANGNP
jgi:hypothetical protein